MERHIFITAVLNIVHRSLILIVTLFFLLFMLPWFGHLIKWGMYYSDDPTLSELPAEILNFVPVLIYIVAGIIIIVSIAGITGGIGVLKKKNWGRILLLIVSFINLVRIPIGTALGIYSIWVLLDYETIEIFKNYKLAIQK